jgi:beta-glucosidase
MAAAIGWFADPVFLGRESALMREMLGDRLPTFTPEEWELLRDSSDYYGCNTCAWTNVFRRGIWERRLRGRHDELYQRWGR